MATAKLADFLLSTGTGPGRVIVVVDADGDVAGSKEAITKLLESPDKVDVVVVENELESWTLDTAVRLGRLSPPQIDKLANGLDLDLLRARSESYRRFESLVLAAAGGA
jgi:sulfur carrier protein ThiS